MRQHGARPARRKECLRYVRASQQTLRVGDVLGSLFERTTAMSMTCWFKCLTDPAFPKRQMIAKTDPANSFRGFDLAILTLGRLTLRWDNTLFTNGRLREWTGDMSDNAWRHVVITQDTSGTAAGLLAYMNGSLMTVFNSVDAGASGAPTTLTTAPLQFSGDPTGRFWGGKIDNVGLYNKTLSAAEVTAVYAGGTVADLTTVGPTGNLVGYWKMGEGASYPTIPDDSSNNNAGTMINMARADITHR